MVDSSLLLKSSFCWNPDSVPGLFWPWIESLPSFVSLGIVVVVVVVVMGLFAVLVVQVHRWIALLLQRRVYQQWIARAQREREERHHRVLSLAVVVESDVMKDNNNNNNDAPDWRTAGELWAALVVVQQEGAGNTTTPTEWVIRAARQCRRAREAYNCVAEELYDEAWIWAQQELPKKLRPPRSAQKEDWPLLYGVPISVKECHAVKGCYSTGGLACRLNKRCRHDCLMVQLLRDAGALIVTTGNVCSTTHDVAVL